MPNINFPTTILGWLSLLGLVVAVGVFIFYQIRKNDLTLLRNSIADLTKRVEFLEKENTRLDTAYKDVKFKKDYLKQIVLQALSNKNNIESTLGKEIKEHLEK